jgi:hypothetical protein
MVDCELVEFVRIYFARQPVVSLCQRWFPE